MYVCMYVYMCICTTCVCVDTQLLPSLETSG